MIGVFDSGAGGLTVIEEIRKTHPNIDICFFADRENAPYGTKSKEELISLVKRDIDILKSAGTDKARKLFLRKLCRGKHDVQY